MGTITRGIANNILGNGAVDGTDALSGTIPANNIANASLSNLTAFPPSVSAGIPQVAGDPPSPVEGDIWYNTNAYKLKVKGALIPGTSWSTGGNLNTGRTWVEDGTAGSATAAIVMGGFAQPGVGVTSNTETYNGTAWTEVNNLNTARNRLGGAGTQTSTLVFSGFAIPDRTVTESWNGTNWTETSNLSVDRYSLGSAGADNTSAIAYGGIPSTTPGIATEEWNVTGPAVNIISS